MNLIIYNLLVAHNMWNDFGGELLSILIHIFSNLILLDDYRVNNIVNVSLFMINMAQRKLKSFCFKNIKFFTSFGFASKVLNRT